MKKMSFLCNQFYLYTPILQVISWLTEHQAAASHTLYYLEWDIPESRASIKTQREQGKLARSNVKGIVCCVFRQGWRLYRGVEKALLAD